MALVRFQGGRYAVTRKTKEKWLSANNANFLGIEYSDCLSDQKLEAILSPYIGKVAPLNFEKGHDPFIQTAHWSSAEQLLETCRQFAEQQPDGHFPSESWLRKRGKYADREGPVYNSLALYVNERLGGFCNVRKVLGHAHASTNAWTPELLIDAWRAFESQHAKPPTGCMSASQREHLPRGMYAEATRIYAAARRLGLLDQLRYGNV